MTDAKENLELVAEAAQSLGAAPCPAPCPAICGNCKHYEPHRDSETGRVHPSKEGRCGWPLPKTKWPLAYRRAGYVYGRECDPSPPYAVGVWKTTNAGTCACFLPNAQALRTAENKTA